MKGDGLALAGAWSDSAQDGAGLTVGGRPGGRGLIAAPDGGEEGPLRSMGPPHPLTQD